MNPFVIAPSPLLIRQALVEHEPWITARLGVPLSDLIILRTPTNFAQLGFSLMLDQSHLAPRTRMLTRLAELITNVSLPPDFPPLFELRDRQVCSGYQWESNTYGNKQAYWLSWQDCPVSLQLTGMANELIAMRMTHRSFCDQGEEIDNLLLFRRADAEAVADLLERIADRPAVRPRVWTLGETSQDVETCGWDQLTLAPEIRRLLQRDFERFFSDRDWYSQMNIPHRRGYLLHGPPGNGKTSAVRAMLSARGLTAYQLRLFGRDTDDQDLERLFRTAAANAPAVVLLEDLDRAFPRSGGSSSKISMQTLLNCIDGVSTAPGVIILATANEPSLLDPAILRRPGRFDRVIHFGNPTSDLRREYLVGVHAALAEQDLDALVSATDGFSYALLRECFILAAQTARESERALTVGDFLEGAAMLRGIFRQVGKKSAASGFSGDGAKRSA